MVRAMLDGAVQRQAPDHAAAPARGGHLTVHGHVLYQSALGEQAHGRPGALVGSRVHGDLLQHEVLHGAACHHTEQPERLVGVEGARQGQACDGGPAAVEHALEARAGEATAVARAGSDGRPLASAQVVGERGELDRLAREGRAVVHGVAEGEQLRDVGYLVGVGCGAGAPGEDARVGLAAVERHGGGAVRRRVWGSCSRWLCGGCRRSRLCCYRARAWRGCQVLCLGCVGIRGVAVDDGGAPRRAGHAQESSQHQRQQAMACDGCGAVGPARCGRYGSVPSHGDPLSFGNGVRLTAARAMLPPSSLPAAARVRRLRGPPVNGGCGKRCIPVTPCHGKGVAV